MHSKRRAAVCRPPLWARLSAQHRFACCTMFPMTLLHQFFFKSRQRKMSDFP